jgi:hypothetical protein
VVQHDTYVESYEHHSTGDVVELGWRIGFGFEAKLAWRGVEEVHPSLYRGVGGVQNDEDSN